MRTAVRHAPKPRQPIRILHTDESQRMTTTAIEAIEAPPTIRIDEGFRRLLPALAPEELSQLEDLILSEGCREPLVTWDDTLIDGHNRYAICKRHGIPFRTVALEFDDRSAVEEWIIHHQFGRRNLSAIARIELATKLEAIYADRARANLKTASRDEDEELPSSPESPGVAPLLKKTKAPVHSREEAAKEAGVSEATYRKGKAVLESGSKELVDKVKRGEVSIHAAYKEIEPKKEAAPAGQCRINGQLVPDPPDIAKARKAGRIAPDVIPEIEEHPTPDDGDDAATSADDIPDTPVGQSDEEWLASLPAWSQLGPGARVRFEADALAYRANEEARDRFAFAVRSVLASASRKGSLPTYLHRLRSFLKINHPKHWIPCPPPEHGGCGGKGVVDITGTCTRCHGGGYLI
jgi:hypothetical protein